MDSIYDVCVVGAGIMGSATARHLAMMGKKTLLLEQFPLPHWRGSSHGQTRIIRCIDSKPHLVKMANDSLKIWKEIQQQAGERILVENAGLIAVEEPPAENLKLEENYLRRENIDYQFLNNVQIKEKFPGLEYGPGYCGIYEKSAGILMADRCLKNVQKQFVEAGGTLCDSSKVLSIHPDDNGVTVKTHNSTYRCEKVIITAGPWVKKIMKPLGIELDVNTHQAPVCYWKIKKPGIYEVENFPTFYDTSRSGLYMYGLPSLEYPGLIKFGPSGKSQQVAPYAKPVDPDMRDNTRNMTEAFIKSSSKYIRKHMPFVESTQPAIVEMCMYTLTPDRNFILDKHPHHSNVIIGSGFSGQGFKHAPVVGKILSELALENVLSYDISHFSIQKYLLNPKSSL